MVKSERIYSPPHYICTVTGNYYFFMHKSSLLEEIRHLLQQEGYELWDYPITEIDHIVENDLNVVLVDCSYYEGNTYVNEYRWFEVPEDFKEEDE